MREGIVISQSRWFMWKKGYRTITKNKGKVLPLIILMCFSIGFGSLMFDMQDSRSRIIKEIIELTNFSDGFIYTKPTNASTIQPILDELSNEYLDCYELRIFINIKFQIDENEYDGLLVGLNLSRSNRINSLIDKNKNDIKDYEYSLEYSFADRHHIKAGENITLKLGSIIENIQISKIGFNPEFMYYSLVQSIAFPSFEPFPVLYIDINHLNDVFIPYNGTIVNEILYKLHSETNQEEFDEIINEKLGSYIEESITQDENYFIKTMREDEKSDRKFLLACVIIFIIGSLILLITVVHRLIEFDLKSISVFQGLGATRKEIIGSYIIFNFLIFIISLILGAILSILAGIPVNNLLISATGIPFFPEIAFTYLNILIIGGLLLFFSILVILLVVIRSFKMEIQESLKYETKFLERKPLVEKIANKIKKNIHPFTSYNIRRIFGKKIYLLFIALALIISSSFLVIAYALPDSVNYSFDNKFNNIEKWDGVASTWDYQDKSLVEEDFSELSSIEYYEFGISDMILFNEDNSSEYNKYLCILAFEKDSRLHTFKSENNAELSNDGECYVTKDLIRKYSLKVGKDIYVKNQVSNNSFNLKIIGIIDDFAQNTIYLHLNSAQKVLEKDNIINTIYFTIESNNSNALLQVEDLEYVNNVILKDNVAECLEKSADFFNIFTIAFGIIFTLFGLLISGIIVKNLVEYRIEDYANMKALGLYDYEIRKSILKEVLIYFLISIPIGIFIGNLLGETILDLLGDELAGIFYHIYPISYLYLGLNLFFIVFIVVIVQFRKVKKMNITEITKMRTFG